MRQAGKEMTVCELLEKKLSVFRRYLSATREMKQTLAGDEERSIAPLISQRQRCINTIDTINRDLDEISGKLKGGLARVSSTVEERTDRYIKKIKDIIDTISPLEGELVTLASTERNTHKAALLKLRQTRKATEGYGGGDGRGARFLDMRR